MVVLTIVVFSNLLFSCNKVMERPTQPNIIVFLVDDMRLMDTSVPFATNLKRELIKHPLNNYYKTPHMEFLVKQGAKLTNFY